MSGPADTLRKLPLLIKNLKRIAEGDPHTVVTMSKQYVDVIVEMLEAARDALAAEAPQWQQLRDLFGFDGWHDGDYQGVASPDQIVTHVKYVSQERARLLFESVAAKRARDALAAQDALDQPSLANDIIMAALGNSDPAPRGLTLPTHERIRDKITYSTASTFEGMLFDEDNKNPQFAAALRAFFEGRA